jgi:hypothetical protein
MRELRNVYNNVSEKPSRIDERHGRRCEGNFNMDFADGG